MSDNIERVNQDAETLLTEHELVQLLRSRNGNPTLLTTWNGERMRIHEIEEAPWLDPALAEWAHFAEMGGIPISADDRYHFYSTEIIRIEDVASGAALFTRL
ncbi:hypothetical protein [Sphingosinicella sp. BN140058]|uniref:hypothetical protein n=1 Tax=Sphingosinicella sp. BN140058 TaxID=1892855 RepID=UPI001012DF35|nr:hypothetical protein [Sphingosinicella sp. BN140058]QAY78933.1 hypothetical protein ETR14_22120 [Sphingosinicella sp. BN140058]